MSQMNDDRLNNDRHVDRYVRITNRERFLIVRALSFLEDACDTLGVADEHGRTTPRMKELIALSRIFCEENWLIGRNINTDKVKRIPTPEDYQEGGRNGTDHAD